MVLLRLLRLYNSFIEKILICCATFIFVHPIAIKDEKYVSLIGRPSSSTRMAGYFIQSIVGHCVKVSDSILGTLSGKLLFICKSSQDDT